VKTAVQALCNSLKGGLDANLTSIVMNAWRVQQLLQQPIDTDSTFSFHSYRSLLVNQFASLKDFNYKLAVALIDSSADPYFQNVLVAHPNRTIAEEQNKINVNAQLGILQDPATLVERI
jgi:hypothetical protein